MLRSSTRTDHHLSDRASDVGETVQQQLTDIRAGATDTAMSLRELATTLRDTAAPALQDASEAAREHLATAREKSAPAVHDAVERARPKVEAAQTVLVETVLPKVTAAISAAAAGLADAKQGAAPYVEQARESAQVGNERAHEAIKVLKGDAAITERKSSRLPWLLGLGLVVAIVAAVTAVRRKRRADDPWASPLTDRPSSPTLRDRATDAAEKATGLADAKDHTGELDEPEAMGAGAVTAADAAQHAADELDEQGSDDDENGRGV